MTYEINTQKFSGPIETLLDLIERKKMEVTELNLAQVTADFLNYLKALAEAEKSPDGEGNGATPRLLADFVVVASKLLLIKSKALLPNLEFTTEEEKEIKDLELQLRFYQNFKPAVMHLKELWESKSFSVSRPLLAGRPPIFYPSANISIDNLFKLMEAIYGELNELKFEAKTIKSPLITLEEKISEIIELFQSRATALKFHRLKEEKSRAEIVVMFLALLHLIHEKLVKAKQIKHFSDIIIEKS